MKKSKIKSKVKHIGITLAILLFLFSTSLVGFFQKVRAADDSSGIGSILNALPRFEFGGVVTKKNLKFCVVSVVPPIIFPFQYLEVELDPTPPLPKQVHKLYYVFLVSKTKLRDRLQKSANVLGTEVPGANQFINLCKNKKKLPKADGVILQVGTSCKAGESIGRKCKDR